MDKVQEKKIVFVCRILVGKPEGNISFGRPRCTVMVM